MSNNNKKLSFVVFLEMVSDLVGLKSDCHILILEQWSWSVFFIILCTGPYHVSYCNVEEGNKRYRKYRYLYNFIGTKRCDCFAFYYKKGFRSDFIKMKWRIRPSLPSTQDGAEFIFIFCRNIELFCFIIKWRSKEETTIPVLLPSSAFSRLGSQLVRWPEELPHTQVPVGNSQLPW